MLLLGSTMLMKYVRQSTIITMDKTTDNLNYNLQNLQQTIGGVSVSLLYILKNAKIFRLQHWMRPGDFRNLIPPICLRYPTTDGLNLIDSLSEKMEAIHKALHIYTVLGQLNTLYEHCSDLKQPIINNIFELYNNHIINKKIVDVFYQLLSSLSGFFIIECVTSPF
jgi:hypothetical protein